MAESSGLATLLDQEMLESAPGIIIASRGTPDNALPRKSGIVLASELRGRLLVRYLTVDQVGQFSLGSRARHFVTPTPYAPHETVPWLGLPNAAEPRTHALILDPARLWQAQGPRWIRFGLGIEYLLPDGFPEEAIMLGWAIEVS